ncbi:hypothetical protein [Azotosporobacter soli]|uniref:hypothetical protein n=1 Tax=Azotosporobacter soli TaxID=3055040 RepID=UPI0031FE5DA0
MKRGKELALVCHCILNQNSVVHPLARNRGAMVDVMAGLMRRGFGIYQLPCPELLYGGLQRCPKTYAQYDAAEYRALCGELAKRSGQELEGFAADGCRIGLLVGVSGSPTCSIGGRQGHFMEALLPRLAKWEKEMRLLEVPQDYEEGKDKPVWLRDALGEV